MIDTVVKDADGREHRIRTADDMNRLVFALRSRRLDLAELMLGRDDDAAIRAESSADYREEVFLPNFQREIERVQGLLDADAAVERRHAKAHAIQEQVIKEQQS